MKIIILYDIYILKIIMDCGISILYRSFVVRTEEYFLRYRAKGQGNDFEPTINWRFRSEGMEAVNQRTDQLKKPILIYSVTWGTEPLHNTLCRNAKRCHLPPPAEASLSFVVIPGTDLESISSKLHPANGSRIGVREDT